MIGYWACVLEAAIAIPSSGDICLNSKTCFLDSVKYFVYYFITKQAHYTDTLYLSMSFILVTVIKFLYFSNYN